MSSLARSLKVGSATDAGRVRANNEDTAMADRTVFLVADGMGGHAAGEVASGIVAGAIRELADRPQLRVEDIVSQLELAQERILASAVKHPEQKGMGTTAAGLALVSAGGSQRWAVFNVGDSRVYHYVDGALTLLTVDHSAVRELLDAGAITEAEVARHPQRNMITRWLGSGPMEGPDIWVFPPRPGERFLLCSDGLSNELSAEQIRDIMQANRAAQETAETLVRAAVAAGGRDNVTVLVIEVDLDENDEEASAEGHAEVDLEVKAEVDADQSLPGPDAGAR
jgi:protein phosphatase